MKHGYQKPTMDNNGSGRIIKRDNVVLINDPSNEKVKVRYIPEEIITDLNEDAEKFKKTPPRRIIRRKSNN